VTIESEDEKMPAKKQSAGSSVFGAIAELREVDVPE